jgi:hypothetical protein
MQMAIAMVSKQSKGTIMDDLMRDYPEIREKELEAKSSTLEKQNERLRAALNGILLQWDMPNRDPTREQLSVAIEAARAALKEQT